MLIQCLNHCLKTLRYIKNKNKFNNAVGATNNLRGLSAKVEFIEDILPRNYEKSSGNAKYSLSPAELDKQYLSTELPKWQELRKNLRKSE